MKKNKKERHKMRNMRINAVIRLIVTIVLTINAFLVTKGYSPIPFSEADLTEFLSEAAAGLMILWIWWKDAPITANAQKSHELLKALKEDGVGNAED